MSRSDLYFLCFIFIQYGQGVTWGGQSMCVFLCWGFEFSLVWFSIRGRCRQLSLIENHTQEAFSHLCFMGDCFLLSVCICTRQNCVVRSLCCFCSLAQQDTGKFPRKLIRQVSGLVNSLIMKLQLIKLQMFASPNWSQIV